ncbi:fluoroquinolone export ABC transporter permease subunit [Mycolicibacterium psychrotolerans]|uniref:Fluoroquinolones export permease protein n=1 Tax=Mycolicibacterium psychrotolerans TaxID=216929 RepID=A0A7I7M4N5_9MYCO|nr:fluoroquinolone transporter permease [Mycolicibacterium psychrotolerans]BBX66837.1 fluoroquinolones export permease protein [Mycolicibacterium psychrotolerans]
MSRWSSALRLEVSTQVRQKFLHAALISGLLWLALLLPIPRDVRPIIEPYVLVGDIAIIGFFFIGGSVFFEKQERTLGALICTPLRFREYVSAKIAVLVAISLGVAVFVVVVTHGMGRHLLPVTAGVVLGTLVMLLTGFASALPFDSVSDWFLSTTVPLAVLALPVLHLSGIWPNPVLYLVPTQGPLLLFGAAFGQLTLAPWQIVYALGYPLACAAGLYLLGRTLFAQFVVERSGVA